MSQDALHQFPIRVYYEDTDMGGIVYHANFLRFIERARSDWVRALGVDQNAMRAAGEVYVVRRVNADFLAPAKFDEELVVETRPQEITPARLILKQTVKRAETSLFEAEVTIVALALETGRPTRLPAEIRALR
ncbi:tol-pal system-associated acyl-CoA thioesterase [Epibacterium sp. SM1979]|uniref:Tol-pal system-associated acyl-CoA thioesterase n=1 Tax=Tritonibacter litoralis TaxID=2662264 RepID=A0A843YL24_9RHOB|nr:tol-pal system-associated acyl-CoA thioesterase [Tritonibacter litoralis]MQQ09387.1 tol-pal system-associated acyl-CoA thioesterase [Tritonibacter litoralis]